MSEASCTVFECIGIDRISWRMTPSANAPYDNPITPSTWPQGGFAGF